MNPESWQIPHRDACGQTCPESCYSTILQEPFAASRTQSGLTVSGPSQSQKELQIRHHLLQLKFLSLDLECLHPKLNPLFRTFRNAPDTVKTVLVLVLQLLHRNSLIISGRPFWPRHANLCQKILRIPARELLLLSSWPGPRVWHSLQVLVLLDSSST